MKIALVCIAKNEDNYIDEWCNYHLKLGFDKIFIYQNNWRTDLNNPNIIKYEMDGISMQRNAYSHFVKNHRDQFTWSAFFDVDEFLVLKKHKNVKDFVLEYADYNAIGINWVLFGNNNHKTIKNNEYSLIKRFTKRQHSVNNHVKCIVKLTNNLIMDIHNPNTYWADTHKNINHGSFTKNGFDDIAQLNHYFCKTEEEFIEKCNRGRADSPIYKRTMNEYEGHNFNEIEDLTAFNFMYNDNNNILNA